MATNLGKKHSCYSCQTKFYDLGKPAAICPKCGADQRNAENAAPTTGRSRRAPVVVEAPPVVEDEFEEESEEIASDDEEELAPAAADAEEEDDDEDEFEE